MADEAVVLVSAEPSKYLHFDDMTWPDPADPGEVEWKLCYGHPTQTDRYFAASVMAAYRQLVTDTQKVRNYKVSAIRTASEQAARERLAAEGEEVS